jgi:hypothetical protein
VPAAGTGTLEPAADPTQALKKRTYFLLPDGDTVWSGTTAGVVSWNVEDPASPERTGGVILPGSVAGLALVGGERGLVAAATGPTGVAIVDPEGPTELSSGTWSRAGGCHAAWRVRPVSDTGLLVACGTSGVAEADLTDPSSPRITRILATGGYVRDVAVLDATRAVAAAGPIGLVIVEFPASGGPRILAGIETGGDARAVEVSGQHAFVASGARGLVIVDLADPASPAIAGTFDPGATDMARGLALEGDRAYLCMGSSGLVILDVADPASPKKLGAFDPGRALNRVAVTGTTLYAANDDAGLLVLDVTDGSSPVQVFPASD